MTLYLTDSSEFARALRDALKADESSSDRSRATLEGDRRGAARAADTPPAVVERLPHRVVAAAATTGALVEKHHPEVIAVVLSLPDDASERTGIVYRCTVAGEAWIPEVTFDHTEQALSVAAATEEDAAHAGGLDHEAAGQDAEAKVTANARVVVSGAAAAAIGGAISRTSPAQVVAIAAGTGAPRRVADRAVELAGRIHADNARARLRREGGAAVSQAVRLGGEIADRLRLTSTQRSRFLQAARAAAVRGGEVPPALHGEETGSVASKAEAKHRLAELERLLGEWRRDEV